MPMGVLSQHMHLIGRENECAELERVLTATQEGLGGFVLLAGEAGVGKTSLVKQTLADRQLLVLVGAAGQNGTVAYGPIIAALRSYLHVVPDGLANCGSLSPYLALLLPELGPPPPVVDQPTLVEAIRSAFAAIARCQPTVLFLDDLHWADTATLDLLPILATASAQQPLLVLGAYRSDEIPRTHPIRRMRTNLRRMGQLREIVVDPLDLGETAALAARVLGGSLSPILAATIFDRTQGLPFFVEELALMMATSGRLRRGAAGFGLVADTEVAIPETVRDAVLLRLDGVADHVRRALEVASVIGLHFDLDLVVELMEGEQGIAEAIERGLISELGEGQGTFRHALVREALYGEVLWTRRRALHRRIAAWLQARGAPPKVIAEHWLAGREPQRARWALLEAAAAAYAVHAYRDAAQAARRALDLWPDGEDEAGRLAILDQLAQCAQLTGELQEAARAWREVADGRRQVGDTQGFAQAERCLATVYELQGVTERSIAARLSAANAFVAGGLASEAAAEWLAAAVLLQRSRNISSALECIALATEQATRAQRIDLQVRALGLEGAVLTDQGQIDQAIQRLRAALAMALEADLIGPTADIYLQLGASLSSAADYVGARDAFRVGFDFCQTRGVPQIATACLGCFAATLERTGEWERAVKVGRDLLASPETTIELRVIVSSVLGMIYAWRGDVKRARSLEIEAGTQGQRIGDLVVVVLCAWLRAYLDELEGEYDSGAEHYRFILKHWEHIHDRYLLVRPLCWAITFFARQGAGDDVRACAKALADIAATVGNAEALAGLAYALGEMALLEGDAKRAARQFDQAATMLCDVGVPYEYAHAQVRAGLALAAAEQREAAITRLTSAYNTARNLRARPLVEAVARELAALGEPVEQRLGRKAARQAKNGGLSRRELEVLRLLAVGRTNREIGQELFLSTRTVEMHVGNILAKLDCRSRAEAIHKSNELGLSASDDI